MDNQNKMPDPVRFLLEDLIRTAAEHHIFVAGFAFGVDPLCFTNFGNCSDASDIHLYVRLCEMVKESTAKGNVVHYSAKRPN